MAEIIHKGSRWSIRPRVSVHIWSGSSLVRVEGASGGYVQLVCEKCGAHQGGCSHSLPRSQFLHDFELVEEAPDA